MNEPKGFVVPAEVAAAIASARPELLRRTPSRTLTGDEVAGLYHAIGQLIAEGYKAQQEVKQLKIRLGGLAKHAEDMGQLIRTLGTHMNTMHRASILPDHDDEGDGE
jgi:hypothetical protein